MGTFLRTLLETIFMVPPKNILGLWAWLRLLRCSNDMTKDTTPHVASPRHFCTVHSVDILSSVWNATLNVAADAASSVAVAVAATDAAIADE